MTNRTATPRTESLQEIERLLNEYRDSVINYENTDPPGRHGAKVYVTEDRAALLSAITRVVQERDARIAVLEKALQSAENLDRNGAI